MLRRRKDPPRETVAMCMVWPDKIIEESQKRTRYQSASDSVVEKLKALMTVDVDETLRTVFVNITNDGKEVITRKDLKTALNYCLPYPRQLRDHEYHELLVLLDPNHTNMIYVEDYQRLFSEPSTKANEPCPCMGEPNVPTPEQQKADKLQRVMSHLYQPVPPVQLASPVQDVSNAIQRRAYHQQSNPRHWVPPGDRPA